MTLIGGADYQKQLAKVNRSPVDIVVATQEANRLYGAAGSGAGPCRNTGA